MEKVYDICCGIDVHKKLIVACLRTGRKSEMREYGATTKELLKLADWLNESGWAPQRILCKRFSTKSRISRFQYA